MLKKIVKIAVVVFVAGFIVMQAFQIDKANQPIVETETLEAAVAVPADVALIMGRSCNDCHTNKTVYPWYANIQPAGWFLKSHIDDGKDELNLSQFNTFELKKKIRKLEEICSEVESGSMPLPSYLWIHREAVMSESDKKTMCAWTKTGIAKLESAGGQ